MLSRCSHLLNLIVALVILAPAAVSADEAARRRVEATIRFLADDLLEGRGTPGRGLDVAALYLTNQLRAFGWQPASDGSYLQTYQLREYTPKPGVYRITLNGRRLQPSEFVFFNIGGLDPARTPKRFDLVFAGHGVVSPERGINDLAGLNLRDRAVVALWGAPWKLGPATPFGPDRIIGKTIEATIRNAGLLVHVSHELGAVRPAARTTPARRARDMPVAYLPEFQGKPSSGIGPFLILSAAAFDRTLADVAGGTYAQWQQRLAAGRHRPRLLRVAVEVRIEARPTESSASNVAALLRGSDPQLRDEWVVLTAHYDHLGRLPVAAGEDGIWNGADDNASGTAAVLEIARRLAAGPCPRRSVLVLFLSGEERGQLGSAHYSRHPLVPYSRMIVNINVDMIGRSTGAVQGIAEASADLFQKTADFSAKHNITVQPDQQPGWRRAYLTDRYHFTRMGVPSIDFFTGQHEDYHQPSDEVKKIRFEELDRILNLMSDLVGYYAQGGSRPAYRRPAWFLTAD